MLLRDVGQVNARRLYLWARPDRVECDAPGGRERRRAVRERVRHSCRLVSSCGSSVDLSTTPNIPEWLSDYDARPERLGKPMAPPTGQERGVHEPGEHDLGDASLTATVHQPDKIDNDRYVRDVEHAHPVLHVPRRLRRAVAEHLRQQRGRARVRLADPHLVERGAAQLRMRVLRYGHDHSVTNGNLCVNGRGGFQHVQRRRPQHPRSCHRSG